MSEKVRRCFEELACRSVADVRAGGGGCVRLHGECGASVDLDITQQGRFEVVLQGRRQHLAKLLGLFVSDVPDDGDVLEWGEWALDPFWYEDDEDEPVVSFMLPAWFGDAAREER